MAIVVNIVIDGTICNVTFVLDIFDHRVSGAVAFSSALLAHCSLVADIIDRRVHVLTCSRLIARRVHVL